MPSKAKLSLVELPAPRCPDLALSRSELSRTDLARPYLARPVQA